MTVNNPRCPSEHLSSSLTSAWRGSLGERQAVLPKSGYLIPAGLPSRQRRLLNADPRRSHLLDGRAETGMHPASAQCLRRLPQRPPFGPDRSRSYERDRKGQVHVSPVAIGLSRCSGQASVLSLPARYKPGRSPGSVASRSLAGYMRGLRQVYALDREALPTPWLNRSSPGHTERPRPGASPKPSTISRAPGIAARRPSHDYMAKVTQVTEGLIPVLVGLRDPAGLDAPPFPGPQERSRLDGNGIGWTDLGADPRWIGMESSDCAAALHPGIYHSEGARERDRYIAGATRRGETAVLVSTIGNADGTRRNPLSVYDASVSLSLEAGSVCGRRLPQGATVGLAGNLNRADHDLALRLTNRAPGAWWSLKLEASEVVFDGGGGPLGTVGPDGNLVPILTDGLGDPVVAVWTSLELDLRWYIVPYGTDWPTLIDWLVQQALPAYVPDAQRRARSRAHVDEAQQTAEETAARLAITELDERYERDKEALERRLRTASEEATPVRDGLLYGTGGVLADAVRTVLTAAGFEVQDLDAKLGGSKSADLLAVRDATRCLIEVKSASGNASEGLVGDLQRHISTWPTLQPAQLPLTHAALVVSHQCRRPPRERASQVYTRPEFVAALPFPVTSAQQLFDWWRTADWPAIRNAVVATPPQDPPDSAPTPGAQSHDGSARDPRRSRLLRWRGKAES